MALKYFRFDLKGKEGSKDNSFLTIKHESPHQGEVTLGISRSEDKLKTGKALVGLQELSQSLGKKVSVFHWNYQDAVMVETQGFDAGLGVLMSSRVEQEGVVPGGATEKLKKNLREKGHVFKEDNIIVSQRISISEPEALEKKHKNKEEKWSKLFQIFRLKKRGRSR